MQICHRTLTLSLQVTPLASKSMYTNLRQSVKLRCFIFIFVLITVIASVGQADVITLRADEWFPYNGTPESTQPGYGIEIAKEIFEGKNHSIDYSTLNWARAVKMTLTGEFNCVIGATMSEIPQAIFPEEPIGISLNAFFVKKGSTWKHTGVDSLQTVSVGIIKDYSYGEGMDAYLKTVSDPLKVQIVTGETPLVLNIRKLIAGRIDVVIEDLNVFQAKVIEMQVADQIELAGIGEYDKSHHLYIAFSPNNPKSKEYARIFDEGIRELRASGRLQQILNRYGLNDWEQTPSAKEVGF